MMFRLGFFMIMSSVNPGGSFRARFMISLKRSSSHWEGRKPMSSRKATSSKPKVPAFRWASTISLSSMPR